MEFEELIVQVTDEFIQQSVDCKAVIWSIHVLLQFWVRTALRFSLNMNVLHILDI